LLGESVPIAGVLGDIPSSAIGAGSTSIGDVTLSLGTGAFLLINTGDVHSGPGLIPLVVDADGSEVVYGSLASANVSGAAIEWLKTGVHMINDPTEVDGIASQVPDSGGVFFVPSFAGLASPPDPFATGLMIGLGQDTTRANIVRAVLEGMAFQVRDMYEGAKAAYRSPVMTMTATGGASASDVLMQILSDTLGIALERPTFTESAALGAAVRAGVSVGFWSSLEEVSELHPAKTRFEPRTSADRREHRYAQWKRAVDRARHWETMDPPSGYS
jgi:glycerol kinase